MSQSLSLLSAVYDNRFFTNRAGGSLLSARIVAPIALEYTGARSVVDLGCGTGDWLSAFRDLGIEDIQGYDGGEAASNLMIPLDRFRKCDLTLPIDAGRKFDLAVCLEVAEHLDARHAPTLIDSLASLAPAVLFSAAIPGQGGVHHVNEQWQDYWVDQFARVGYATVDCIRPRIWNTRNVSVWYAQNILLFVDAQKIDRYPKIVADHDRWKDKPVAVVHPRTLTEKLAWPASWVDPKCLTAKSVLAALPSLVLRSAQAHLRQLFGKR